MDAFLGNMISQNWYCEMLFLAERNICTKRLDFLHLQFGTFENAKNRNVEIGNLQIQNLETWQLGNWKFAKFKT